MQRHSPNLNSQQQGPGVGMAKGVGEAAGLHEDISNSSISFQLNSGGASSAQSPYNVSSREALTWSSPPPSPFQRQSFFAPNSSGNNSTQSSPSSASFSSPYYGSSLPYSVSTPLQNRSSSAGIPGNAGNIPPIKLSSHPVTPVKQASATSTSPLISSKGTAGSMAPGLRTSLSLALGIQSNIPLASSSFCSNLSGLPFSKEALPHAYAKMAIAANRSREDADAEDPAPLLAAPNQQSFQWNGIDMSGVGLCQISPSIFSSPFSTHFMENLCSLYLTANSLYELPHEIGLLKNLTILHAPHNRLKSLPGSIGSLHKLKELFLQENLLTSLPFSLGSVHTLKLLNLDGNPWTDPMLTSVLASIMSTMIGTSHTIPTKTAALVIPLLRDNAPMPQAPPPRSWETVQTGMSSSTCSFTVFSYNILTDTCADPSRYGYTPSWSLLWPYRRESILQTLRSSSADFLCLQEVEFGAFGPLCDDLDGVYQGILLPKHRIRTMAQESQKQAVDGCAIFWKAHRFVLEQVFPIEFSSMSASSSSSSTVVSSHNVGVYSTVSSSFGQPSLDMSCPDLFNRAFLKDNVALIGRFKDKLQTSCPIFIGSVHLQWDPSFRDVKLLQTIILCEKCKAIRTDNPTSPIVLAGDFNSEGDSGVVQLMSTGTVEPDNPDWMSYSYPPYTTNGYTLNSGGANNNRKAFSSVYQYPSKPDSSHHFTNYCDDFCGMIDYIWYSANAGGLSLSGRLALPHRSLFDGIPGLPSPHYPSDHLPLMAEFMYDDKRQSSPSAPVATNIQLKSTVRPQSPFKK